MRERIEMFFKEVVEHASVDSVVCLILSAIPVVLLTLVLLAGAVLGFFFPDSILRLSAVAVSLIGMVPAGIMFYNGVNTYFRA